MRSRAAAYLFILFSLAIGIAGIAAALPFISDTARPPVDAAHAPPGFQLVQAGQVTVQITNPTDDSVLVIGIGADDEQELLHELPAGESYSQATSPGATLGFVQGEGWLGDAYVVTGAADESVTVPYIVPEDTAGAPTADEGAADQPQTEEETVVLPTVDPSLPSISVFNATGEPITIYQIGANKEQTELAELAANEVAPLQLAPGTLLGFAQNDAWLGDPYIVAGSIDEQVSVPYQKQAEAPATDPNAPPLGIANMSAEPISVVAIQPDGTQIELVQVPAGEALYHPVTVGAKLGFAQGESWLGSSYVVAGTPGETVNVPYAKPAEIIPLTSDPNAPVLKILNASAASISVVTFTADREVVPLFDLRPGDNQDIPADIGTTFAFVQDDKYLGEPYIVAGTPAEVVSVPYTAPPPVLTADADAPTLKITNNHSVAVIVAAIVGDAAAKAIKELAPGESLEQQADIGTKFLFGANKEPVGSPYVMRGTPNEAVTVPYDASAEILAQQQGPTSTLVLFRNPRPHSMTIATMDPSGLRANLYDVPADTYAVQHKFLPGTAIWFFKTGTDEREGDRYTVIGNNYEVVVIPYVAPTDAQAKHSGPGSKEVFFGNQSGVGITVAVQDDQGFRADLTSMDAAQLGSTTVLPNTKLYFFKTGTSEEVGEPYTTTGADRESVSVPYRSISPTLAKLSGEGAIDVTFQNTSPLDAIVVSEDETGEKVVLFDVFQGSTLTQKLKPDTLLWFYKRDGGEAFTSKLPFMVRPGAGQRVTLPYVVSDAELEKMIGKSLQEIGNTIQANLVKQRTDAKTAPVCWRGSYGRGVGTVPRNCPPGQSEDTAGLCYDNCRAGYKPFVTMCIPSCPAGFREDGLYCYKPSPYKRAEYPINAGEFFSFGWLTGKGSLQGARDRCRANHGNNCVAANGNTIVYETCKAGYHQAPIITNLCSPNCPANTVDIGISCQKLTYDRGAGSLMSCGSGKERDAGLCYNSCKAGTTGVGPVCWDQCPATHPVSCGASCGKTAEDCRWSVGMQIASPLIAAGSIALTVVTAGGGAGAVAGAKAGGAAGTVGAKLTAQAGATAAKASVAAAAKGATREAVRQSIVQSVKAAMTKAALKVGTALTTQGAKTLAREVAFDFAIGALIGDGFFIYGNAKALVDQNRLREDLKTAVKERMSNAIDTPVTDAQITAVVNQAMLGAEAEASTAVDFPWSSLDPTGIADIVMEYNLPICSDLK